MLQRSPMYADGGLSGQAFAINLTRSCESRAAFKGGAHGQG